MFFRRQKRAFLRPRPPARITLDAIGFVKNAVTQPQPRGWARINSDLVLLPEHTSKLAGIEAFSHVIVLFFIDLAEDAPEKPETLTLASGRRYGIFATRSQLRPNHLGVSVVPRFALQGATLRVRGLDAIDGTPILDIKPYLPEYDAVPDARIPGGDES